MESVWDYPRPPAIEPFPGLIQIEFGGELICESTGSWRVLETSHPPGYYIPPGDFTDGSLQPAGGQSLCEWKGVATYLDVVAGGSHAPRKAWMYPDPAPKYRAIKDFVAVYPGAMDACYVDGEQATPQPGGFYGGWITSNLEGPFKGSPGTLGW